MSTLNTRLDLLIAKIKQENPIDRFRLQPQLDRLIFEIEAQGDTVQPYMRQLNEELRNEAIEAQFDNMPV